MDLQLKVLEIGLCEKFESRCALRLVEGRIIVENHAADEMATGRKFCKEGAQRGAGLKAESIMSIEYRHSFRIHLLDGGVDKCQPRLKRWGDKRERRFGGIGTEREGFAREFVTVVLVSVLGVGIVDDPSVGGRKHEHVLVDHQADAKRKLHEAEWASMIRARIELSAACVDTGQEFEVKPVADEEGLRREIILTQQLVNAL